MLLTTSVHLAGRFIRGTVSFTLIMLIVGVLTGLAQDTASDADPAPLDPERAGDAA